MNYKFRVKLSPMKIIIILMILWLFAISTAHYFLNIYEKDVRKIKMGYMPVVTNISAPLLDYVTKDRSDIRLEALKFASFADMAEAFKQNQIQAAFIIAPLSIVLYDRNPNLSIVYIGNRNESDFVVRSDLNVTGISELIGRTIAVPLRYSGHNLFLYKLAYDAGIDPKKLNIVEMQPPDMAAALSSGDLDAYCVGEPFAAQTLYDGQSKLIGRVEDQWPGFICNLVILKNAFISENPVLAKAFANGLVRAGLWARDHQEEAVKILAQYWNRDEEVIRYALNTPPQRVCYNRYKPKVAEIQQIADLMYKTGLIDHTVTVNNLLNTSLTAEVDTNSINLNNIFDFQ